MQKLLLTWNILIFTNDFKKSLKTTGYSKSVIAIIIWYMRRYVQKFIENRSRR